MKKRISVKIGGESGQGINSIGEILAKSLKRSGFFVFGYREYPSLIKGGYASYQIDISDSTINSSSRYTNLLICLSRVSLLKYLRSINQNGILIHNLKHLTLDEKDNQFIRDNNIKIFYLDSDELLQKVGAKKIMSNTIFLGILGHLLGLNQESVGEILAEIINKGEEILNQNLASLNAGYDYAKTLSLDVLTQELGRDESTKSNLLISGNEAIALGAYGAGARAYYSYPMTPASSILTFLSEIKGKTGMVVRQVDDEITAAQMMIGSMFMGTRAFVGTSGGGFDLMTESLSLAGIVENPAVFILAQRPGPATGLPTWTAQGDLDLAVHSGHGEFSRIVLAASDIESAYLLIQEAFNLTEKFQTPVILLTEKQIAESLYQVKALPEPVAVDRSLEKRLETLHKNSRYEYSESGISRRWLPGESSVTYVGNSDEHLEDGSLTEESEAVKRMFEKRMSKFNSILNLIPEPKLLGKSDPEIIFVGFGSTRSVIEDVANIHNVPVGYLHYEYLFPTKTSYLQALKNEGKRLIIIENNYTSQLGGLIKKTCGIEIEEKLLKYDGRPFFVEDILEYLDRDKHSISQRLKFFK